MYISQIHRGYFAPSWWWTKQTIPTQGAPVEAREDHNQLISRTKSRIATVTAGERSAGNL